MVPFTNVLMRWMHASPSLKGRNPKILRGFPSPPAFFQKTKILALPTTMFINFYSSHYLWPFLTWANRKSQEYGCVCGCIVLISGFIDSHHWMSPYINMSKIFCTLPPEKHASPKHSQIKDYSFVCPNDGVFNIICFSFFGVDILKINDDFYQSLTLYIMIFFSFFFLKMDDLNLTFYYFYRYLFLFIFIGSTKPFSFAQISRSKDQMFEQSIMG